MRETNRMRMLLSAVLVTAAALAPQTVAAKEKVTCTGVIVGSAQQETAPAGGDSATDEEERRNNRVFNGESRTATTFSATRILDLDFAVLFAPTVRTAEPHVVEFRVYTPKNNLYQTMSVPFTTDVQRKGQRLSVPGYPDVVPVRVLSKVTHKKAKGLIATTRLPVAGTPIVNNSLYGVWRAEVVIDGAPARCGAPLQFTITQ